MTTPDHAHEGVQRAERLLLANGGELGLMGASGAYRQVWARDSMLCGLGLLCCPDPEGTAVHRRSLETLRAHQSELGKIPHNVGLAGVSDPALIAHGGQLDQAPGGGEVVMDTAHAGCIDSSLWYILGQFFYFQATGDLDFLRSSWDSLGRALLWLRYQDSNECGLLEAHEAMDWADLFANRYNTLYANVLWVASWRSMARLAAALGHPAGRYVQQAANVRRKLNTLLWVGPEEPKDWQAIGQERKEWLYPLKRIETELVERPFYLPYVAFRDYADRFDTAGNLLAILFGAADGVKSGKILDYIHGCGLDEPYPVRCLYPPVYPGEKDWRDYYRVRNLNLPHHYHNGGAWPYIGGLYVAALVRMGRMDEAARQFEKLTAMNRAGKQAEWGFNEWFHGLSGRPMGYDGQSWSAALYVYAQDALTRGTPRFLNFD
ncbi:MAG: glycogen debranching protein [Anaerolineae bacterium]|nr:glycogen debranching protein [Anaerolineae bacterium]